VNIDDIQKQVKLKGCIEVSYRRITNFTTRTDSTKNSNVDKPSIPGGEGPSRPVARKQLPMAGIIPEKALKGDARSHQAMHAP